jgi:hypothetical protein
MFSREARDGFVQHGNETGKFAAEADARSHRDPPTPAAPRKSDA